MNNLKKITAVLAATTMVTGLLAGCGAEETADSAAQASAVEEKAVTAETTETVKESSNEDDAVSQETKTVTHLIALNGLASVQEAGYDTINDTEYAKAIREATGVDVQFEQVESHSEAVSLYIAEGKYADVLEFHKSHYPGGVEAAYEDGVIIPLNDIIDQYMPHVKAWMEANPKDAEAFYSADGNIYACPFIYETTEQTHTTGLFIRKDWLEELGLEVPATIDDWHDVLTAIKEEKGVIPYTNYGTTLINGSGFGSAYMPAGDDYYIDPESGKVVFNRGTEAYREFITTMSEWYAEGLIDSDVASIDKSISDAKIKNSEAAASWGWNASLDFDVDLTAVSNPARAEGETAFSRPAARVATFYGMISTQCEDVEAAARYLDWYYSEEGIMVTNFGVEGVSYTVEDGEIAYTDEILNNPDGLTVAAAQAKYIREYSGHPGIRSYDFAKQSAVKQATKDSYSIWSKGSADYILPGAVSPDAEKLEEANKIKAELKTYSDEMIMKFVIGTEDIEEKWDEYMANMNQLGLQELNAIWQEAYENYLAK